MDYMARLDFKEGEAVTYNYLETEKVRKEMWEEKVETWEEKMKQDKKILSKTNKNLSKTNKNLKKKNFFSQSIKS